MLATSEQGRRKSSKEREAKLKFLGEEQGRKGPKERKRGEGASIDKNRAVENVHAHTSNKRVVSCCPHSRDYRLQARSWNTALLESSG
jgi:hypothetical protein